MSISQPLFTEWLLRGVALSAAAATTYALLRPGDRARSLLLAVTTAGLLILPLALWASPRWALGWISLPQGVTSAVGTPSGISAGATGWIFVLWVLGAAAWLSRIALGTRALAPFRFGNSPLPADGNLLRCASQAAADLGIKMPQITLADSNRSPFATGLRHPKIVLPRDASSWSLPVLRAVLLHEMAHIRRGDLWMQAAGNIVCALYWFNPLVWFLHRRLAREREYLADALVLECGTDAKRYAHALLDVAGSLPGIPVGGVSAIALAGASRLEDRIRRLIGGVSSSGGSRFRLSGVLLLSTLSVAASACLDPFAKAPDTSGDAADKSAGQIPWTKDEIETRLSASPFPGA